jgi:YVTN family beta-propeller protein
MRKLNFNPALLLLVLAVGFQGFSAEKANENQGVIIVANKSSNDVYFIGREDGEVLKILPTGIEPHEVEVSDDGRIAVVCNYGNRENPGNSLSVYDIENLELVREIDLGEHTRPHGMHWMPGTSNMLVTTEGSRYLLMVDIEAGEIIHEMYTGEDISHMVTATPDGKSAFVSSIRTGNVTKFDLESQELVKRAYSGEGAEGIAVSPDGSEVWVTNRGENTVSVFDAQTLEKLEKLEAGDFPIRARFTPDGRYLLVSNARSGDVSVFDAPSKELVSSITLTLPESDDKDDARYFSDFEGSSVPIGLIAADNNTAYVASTRSDLIVVIDLETFEIADHIPAGEEPDGINFSPLNPE